MSKNSLELPTLIATSVVRGAEQGASHGGIYLIDFVGRDVRQVVDWDTSSIDFQGRGWDRGLRGIAFFGGEIYIAASDELFVYDQQFRIQRSFRSSYLKHCHEIHQLNNHLYLTSTGHDSILAFDLEKQNFFWAIHLALGEEGPVGTAYDPNGINGPGGANGPPAQNLLHLNNIHADKRGMFASGMRTEGILHIGNGNVVSKAVDMPQGMHNARPFRDGVLFNDTSSDLVRYVGRDGKQIALHVPVYDPAELTHTELGDEKVARQGFARGLCVIDERFIAAGSSPSTVTVYDLESSSEVARVNFSMDIRNAIHGLEVWPY
ncbi:MAG: hypothetical protein KJO33_11645 [Gammaproteobacteria bacterium]|nr:hypothetical protein [Gammaproteobacteria bacterium]NNK34028.1 hypothetical protein [Xanthomonadales bacterium]